MTIAVDFGRKATKQTNKTKSQLAFHIYYVEYENTLMCKRISRGGGNDV